MADDVKFSVYRNPIFKTGPNPKCCVASIWVSEMRSSSQCSRHPTKQYGGYGWCGIHYPPTVQERARQRERRYEEESRARNAKWTRERLQREQHEAALDAIRKIAAGHNNPQALARDVLKITEEPANG